MVTGSFADRRFTEVRVEQPFRWVDLDDTVRNGHRGHDRGDERNE
jgi:hypothetical protein